jgi:hypothetical protein
MNKNILQKILAHPDKDEIIAKLVLDISAKDINEWLSSKYSNVAEKKFIIGEKSIKVFKDTYLDVYSLIQEDIVKTRQAVATSTEDRLELSVRNNSTYRNKMMELAGKEIDVRQMIARLCIAIETRVAQVFDAIQEDPNNINTKIDRLMIDYTEVLGNILEKYYKFTEGPADAHFVRNNITMQFMDRHILVIQEAIRDVLSEMDLASSMLFMERFSEKMSKLKAPDRETMPNTDVKLAEAKLLNETINKKLNETI